MAFILVDTYLIKFYDTIDKNILPISTKQIIFSVISFLCLGFQLIILRYLRVLNLKINVSRRNEVELLNKMVQLSQYLLIGIFAFIVFEIFFHKYYSTILLTLTLVITYSMGSVLLGKILL